MLPILPKSRVSTQVKTQTKALPTNKKTDVKKIGSVFLLIALFLLLTTQGIPLALSYFQGELSQFYTSENYVPVSQSFLQSLVSIQYVDPGQEYFMSLVNNQQSQKVTIDTNYNSAMKINIPSAKIQNILLSPNIPGADKNLYEGALKHGVAHLRGTPLPGDGGTPIIYGHSGLSGLLVSPNNPQIIFSRLDATQVGDSVTITKDNKELQYLVTSKKIIEPSDVTFLSDGNQKERVILITCWPLGIGTKRLVVIADRVNE